MPRKATSGSKTAKKPARRRHTTIAGKRYAIRKKKPTEKIYYGIGALPKGRKRPTARTALKKKQVRFYGTHKVPKPVLTVYLHNK